MQVWQDLKSGNLDVQEIFFQYLIIEKFLDENYFSFTFIINGTFFGIMIFQKVHFVKIGPIFVSSALIHYKKYKNSLESFHF